MQPIHPNPENGNADEVEEAIRCAPCYPEKRRYLAIRMLLFGIPLVQTAKILSVSVRTVQLWVNRWNHRGIDSLKTRLPPGAMPKIPRNLDPLLCDLLQNPEIHGETHWTIVKLHGRLKTEIQLECGYSTLTRFFRDRNFVRKVPRSWPHKQDEAARDAFRKQMMEWLNDPTKTIWFCDETGFTGDPRPRKLWALKSERLRVLTTGFHLRENVIGAVQPQSGRLFALQVPELDRDVFQVFLDEFASENHDTSPLLVLDNATWHKVKSLDWHHFLPVFLPPYSPDLNPIERLWLYLKEHYFNNWYAKRYTDLQGRVTWAFRQLFPEPQTIRSVTQTL